MNKPSLSLLLLIMCMAVTGTMSAKRYVRTSDGVEVMADNGINVRLQVIQSKIIRVSAIPSAPWPDDASLVVLPDARDTSTGWDITDTDSTVSVATGDVTATVSLASGAVSFADKTGREILRECADGRTFKPITVESTDGYTVSQTFESPDDNEGIYGLGQHQSNEWNYKGRNEQLYQYNTKVSVPFVVSTGNYGLLWDSYSLCRWGRHDDYRQLGQVFRLRDKEGREGALTGTYRAADGTELVRREDSLYFEHLQRGDLSHVVNLPRDFRMSGATVTYEGEIEPLETGRYEFSLYYSGYQTVYIGGKKVVDTRWRTAWNPNSYKFAVDLTKGKRVPLRIEWQPNGSVAYCGLRAYEPADSSAQKRMSWWGEMQDMIDYYFVCGDDMDDVISGYRRLTGKAPVMPRWAMGFWQSREKYNTRDEVLGTVAEFRRRDIPLDNIVIDWLHWPQDSWGSHEFDPKRFPEPKGMVDSIHAMDARVMVSVWPKYYVTTDHYKEFDRNGWMYPLAVRDSIRDWVGPGYLGSFYDAYSPGARRLFWNQINDHYVPLGIDAWWMDASEPNIRDCTDIQYRKDLMTPTALGPSTKYFNAYALMNAQAIYDGQRSVDPDRRVFLLTRSGFAGQQRYSTATWSGDIATRWEDMQAQITAGLNFSASGIPYWTMDIGGFCVEDRYVKAQKTFDKTGVENADLAEWRELNTRWYQFGTFVPLFRSHGQWPRREPWNIAPDSHPAYKSIVSYARLRYRLMPYVYSLAGMTHFNDYTIMRPMVMDFTADTATRDIGDQYMFGPALMVAPVCRYGARRRDVYFPADNVWYDFYSGSAVDGGQTLEVDAPYERIPLYVRGGSILPTGVAVSSTARESDSPTTLLVYAGRDGEFTLYEDEGVNYNYEKGRYSMIPLRWNDASRRLTIGDRLGDGYDGMKTSREFNVVVIDRRHPVADPVNATGIKAIYDGTKIELTL